MINKIMKKTKNPSLREKVYQYELFLHKINSFIVSCNNEGVRELVANADNWSYAHRRGEFLTDKQRDEIINNAFWNLLKTPNADRGTEERRKAWTEQAKQKEQAFIA
jgi:hypothetical protein